MDKLLPWQQPHWSALQQRIMQQRIPHALLLHGPQGSGKGAFARLLSQRLLCSQPTESSGGLACGHCPSCKLFQAGTHPDYYPLVPDEGKYVLAVERVREMVVQFAFTPQCSGRKVVSINPAESMNNHSANSLLKTLEEPPGEAVMILVSHTPARLLATIRSRCQQIAFPTPPREMALAWLEETLDNPAEADAVLQLAEGAPLSALLLNEPSLMEHYQQMGRELIQLLEGRGNLIQIGLRWSKQACEAAVSLRWLQQWVVALIKNEPQTGAVVSEPLSSMLPLMQGVDRRKLFLFYDKVAEAIALSTTAVNKELLFDGLLLDWSKFR
ncbi:MAG: DNA polymerase III subunit delta' [Gammaproteobacteria bacterium]|jgi:DNA polymerase III subunit delta'|nr:DNA polymerase III subunit delta' [Gammaproteobacteria bacterium]MBT7306564.1 DNA polymerase III subunit delta' [Gammaproteobacteria bacterium]